MRKSVSVAIAGAIVLAAMAVPVLAQQMEGFAQTFVDVQEEDFYWDDLQYFSNEGIIQGYGNGRFGGNNGLRRGELLAILGRYDRTMVQPLRDELARLRAHVGMSSSSRSGSPLCDGHAIGESYLAPDGCNRCTCTQSGAACTKMYCPPRSSSSSSSSMQTGACAPYVCRDGTEVPRCSADGHVINYFAPPCYTHGGEASICYSSRDCSGLEYCSTEDGDCRSPCAPGETCIQVCSGICKTR